MSYIMSQYAVMLYHDILSHAMCHMMSWYVMSCHIVCIALFHFVITCHVTLYYVMWLSCNFTSHYVISCYVRWGHVTISLMRCFISSPDISYVIHIHSCHITFGDVDPSHVTIFSSNYCNYYICLILYQRYVAKLAIITSRAVAD